MKRIIILGGGVAGLAAAYKLRRAAEAGEDVSFVLVEKDERLGGKIHTDLAEDPDGGLYVADGGSDCFLTEKGAVHRVAKSLGIFEDETGTLDDNKKTFIVKRGKLIEMPDGMMMFAPTKLVPLATSRLYSWPAKLRMALDLVLPRKERWAEGDTAQQHDESLESLVVRRLGRECLDRLAEPLAAGVNGDDPAEMSVAARYPMLLDMEQKHGSLVKGFLAQRKKVDEMRKKYPPKPGSPRRTFFSSFKSGLQHLTDSMADAAGRDNIRTGIAATALSRTDGGWHVDLADGSVLDADGVIVATEVWAAAQLSEGLDVELTELLQSIPCSSCATVLLAFGVDDCPIDRKWHGILTPMVEHSAVGGISLMSSKWPDRAPEGTLLFRVFLGGPRDQSTLLKSDAELIELARTGLVDLLGVKADAVARYAKLFRWEMGMPQYTLGHLDRVDRIEEVSRTLPGFACAGNAYRGVGVPNTLESGEAAVSKVLGDFGIVLAEDQQEEKRLY